MVKTIQCPVCTLYLHAGMNLCDHLETHPKEQVIKALVQMTISGGPAATNNSTADENIAGIDDRPRPNAIADKIPTNDTPQKLKDNSFVAQQHQQDPHHNNQDIHDLNSNCSSFNCNSNLNSNSNSNSNGSLSMQSSSNPSSPPPVNVSQISNNSLQFSENNATDGCSSSVFSSALPITTLHNKMDISNNSSSSDISCNIEKKDTITNNNTNNNMDNVKMSRNWDGLIKQHLTPRSNKSTNVLDTPTDFTIFNNQQNQSTNNSVSDDKLNDNNSSTLATNASSQLSCTINKLSAAETTSLPTSTTLTSPTTVVSSLSSTSTTTFSPLAATSSPAATHVNHSSNSTTYQEYGRTSQQQQQSILTLAPSVVCTAVQQRTLLIPPGGSSNTFIHSTAQNRQMYNELTTGRMSSPATQQQFGTVQGVGYHRLSQIYSNHSSQQYHNQQQQQPNHHHHNHQSSKLLPSTALSTPPPLQLFTYQSGCVTTQQHQKPPPAYGTAISQIRSQNNKQNKLHHLPQHNVASSTGQQQQMRQTIRQQQEHQTLPNTEANQQHTSTLKNNFTVHVAEQHHQQQQRLITSSTNCNNINLITSSTIVTTSATKKTTTNNSNNSLQRAELPMIPHVAAVVEISTENIVPLKLRNSESDHKTVGGLMVSNNSGKQHHSLGAANSAHNSKHLPPPLMPSTVARTTLTTGLITTTMTSVSTVAMLSATTTTTAVASLQSMLATKFPATLTTSSSTTTTFSTSLSNIRLNNILPSVVMTAGTASMSNSVLRYADSPVAHYLERDNGDFIVQETPKHIMEYVEKDDGEFSVIEHIYQSPPSVLHIHEEADDNDSDDDQIHIDDRNHNKDNFVEKNVKNNKDAIKSNKSISISSKENGKNSTIKDSFKKSNTKKDKSENIENSYSGSSLNHYKQNSKIIEDDHSGMQQKSSLFSNKNDQITSEQSIDSYMFSDNDDDFMSASGESDNYDEDEINKTASTKNIQRKETSKTTSTSRKKSSDLPEKPIKMDVEKTIITEKTLTGNSVSTSSLSESSTTTSTISEMNVTKSNDNPLRTDKKKTKNTITVLSDVQLNLNEYLDLVGNIIASSKVSTNRSNIQTSAMNQTATKLPTGSVALHKTTRKGVESLDNSLPIVKIEKEEPVDYDEGDTIAHLFTEKETDIKCQTNAMVIDSDSDCKPPTTTNAITVNVNSTATVTINKNSINNSNSNNFAGVIDINKQETDVINLPINSVKELQSRKQRNTQDLNRKTFTVDTNIKNEQQQQNVVHNYEYMNINCSSNATSVIRMTSTATSNASKDLLPMVSIPTEESLIISKALQSEGTSTIIESVSQSKSTTGSSIMRSNNCILLRKMPKKLVIKPKTLLSKAGPEKCNVALTGLLAPATIPTASASHCQSNIIISVDNSSLPSTSHRPKMENDYHLLTKQNNDIHNYRHNANINTIKRIDNIKSKDLMKINGERKALDENKAINSTIQKQEILNNDEDIDNNINSVRYISVKNEPNINYEKPASSPLHEKTNEDDNETDLIMIFEEEKPCIIEQIIPEGMQCLKINKTMNTEEFLREKSNTVEEYNSIRHNEDAVDVNDIDMVDNVDDKKDNTYTMDYVKQQTSNTGDDILSISSDSDRKLNVINSNGATTSMKKITYELTNGKQGEYSAISNNLHLNVLSSTITRSNSTNFTSGNTSPMISSQSNSNQNFLDYPFNLLYSNTHNTNVSQHSEFKCAPLFYPQTGGSHLNEIQPVNSATAATATACLSSSSSLSSMGAGHKEFEDPSRNLSNKLINQHPQQQRLTNPAVGVGGIHHWYNENEASNATCTSTSTSIIVVPSADAEYIISTESNTPMSVDGLVVGGSSCSNVNKYLDLDACKIERKYDTNLRVCSLNGSNSSIQQSPASPSNSCSLSGGTGDNSLGGIYSNSSGALNIRTDEKMPAKGEISEQESNCDIENSWSQPMYTDMSARFFKTSMPGIFTHDSGWNQDDYFSAQDLSASGTTDAQSLPITGDTSRGKNNQVAVIGVEAQSDPHSPPSMNIIYPTICNNLHSPNNDALPSTSSKVKKKRKRNSHDEKTVAFLTGSENTTGVHIEQNFIEEQQEQQQQHYRSLNGYDLEFSGLQLQQQQLHPSSPRMLMPINGVNNSSMEPSSSNYVSYQHHGPQSVYPVHPATGGGIDPTTINYLQSPNTQKSRGEKCYECPCCYVKYVKLKDRNAHMVKVHKYIRQNRKLLRPLTLTSNDETPQPPNSTAIIGFNDDEILLYPSVSTTEMSEAIPSTSGIIKISGPSSTMMIQQHTTTAAATMSSSTVLLRTSSDSLRSISPVIEDSKHGIIKLENTEPHSLSQEIQQQQILANASSGAMDQLQHQEDQILHHFVPKTQQQIDNDKHIDRSQPEMLTTDTVIDGLITVDLELKNDIDVEDQEKILISQHEHVLQPQKEDRVQLQQPQSQAQQKKKNSSLLKTGRANEGTSSLSQSTARVSSNALSTKLTSVYRMLVTYNISHLKMKEDDTDIDTSMVESLIFYCYICRQSFSSVKMYDIHLTEHPAECFSCGKKFQRWKNLALHLKRHMGWKEFGCNVCEKKFVVRSALVEHMRMHSGQSPLACKICGKHFKRYSNLTQHRKRHIKQSVRKKEYVCFCGEVLPSKARLLWHKETHDSKPKCCPHCCDRFIHVNSLKRHIRLAHSDKFKCVEPVECTVCKQVFSKASMKSHMSTHSSENQYDCAICNKSFSTKWNLKVHSWVHANRTAKPYKCEHCPKAFVREIDFKNHMNAHKQIRPYTCEVCGCKFIRKYNYLRHRREHHGDKKFACDICKKSFHRHYYLIEHRRIHTGERPFQCTICGKSSTTKTNHNKHMKIHHSRDPFTAEV